MDEKTKNQRKKDVEKTPRKRGRPRKTSIEQLKSGNTAIQLKDKLPLRHLLKCQFCLKTYKRNQINEHVSAKCLKNKQSASDECEKHPKLYEASQKSTENVDISVQSPDETMNLSEDDDVIEIK